ncbi:MAG: PdxA family dehydrogenase, partial [Nitrososphaera sp.]
VVESAIRHFHLPAVIEPVTAAKDALNVRSAIPLLDIPLISPEDFTYGQPSAVCAAAATEVVKQVVNLATHGLVAGIACAPVNKQALLMAGPGYVGHTELISSLCDAKDTSMFFFSNDLALMSVTGHIQLSEVPQRVSGKEILRKIRLGAKTFQELHDRRPTIAVCSLDPHSGEGGLLGRVDIDIVAPAVRAAVEEGYFVQGPIPADAVFRPYIISKYNLVLGMYHDQVKAAIAAFDSDRFISYLAGAPLVRTTTTHGTAFDIAGKGVANPSNMRHAIQAAGAIAIKRFLNGHSHLIQDSSEAF